MVNSSCSTSGTRRVTLVISHVISHDDSNSDERKKANSYINVLKYKLTKVIMECKNRFKIPKGSSETVKRRRIYDRKKIADNYQSTNHYTAN